MDKPCREALRLAYAELPSALEVGDQKLTLNGSGSRTKYLMEMYVPGLYLAQPSSDPATIVAADAPMAIRLQITSGLVTEEKLVESLNEGFHNAMGGKPEAIRKEIDLFRKCLAAKIAKGDVLDLVYIPGHGVTSQRTARCRVRLKGSRLREPYLTSGSPIILLTKTSNERCCWVRETAGNPCGNNRVSLTLRVPRGACLDLATKRMSANLRINLGRNFSF